MSSDFNNSEIEQVYDDFAHHKGDYDDLMVDALKDINSVNINNDRDEAAFSDDITALMKEHGAKFGKALATASAANRAEWAPKLAKILKTAMDMNPDNTASLVNSAYEMEKAYGGDVGILSDVAERATFRYKEHMKEVMAIVDKHMQDYDAGVDKNEAAYKAFYKVYTNAFRRTGSAKYSKAANEITDKIEMLKGNITTEKLIQRVKNNPSDEAVLESFEKNLKLLLSNNPEAGVADITGKLKDISKIEDAAAREEVYTIIIDAIDGNVKAGPAEKSGILFSAFDYILKTEKDEDIRKSVTVSAVGFLQGVTDENGALIIADGAEKQTLRALKKMADSYGNYVGLKDLVAKTAEKYQKWPEIHDELKATMLKALDYEERNGVETDMDSRSAFEKEMLWFKKNRDNKTRLDTQIYALLNIPHKTNGYQKDPNKPYYPSKSDMRKVSNLLSQYKTIDYTVILAIEGKIDQENFTNIDDAILGNLSARTDRMAKEDGVKFEEKLTSIRAQMHLRGIQQKKEKEANAPKQWRESAEPKPDKKISFSIKDLPDSKEM